MARSGFRDGVASSDFVNLGAGDVSSEFDLRVMLILSVNGFECGEL